MLVNCILKKVTSKHMYGKIAFFFPVVRIRSVSLRCYSKESSKRLLEFLATMPKPNSNRISEAQKQRQQIAKKAKKYSSSTVYLQVVGSGARGAPNTLYLFSDQKRYLFNCGECTQRLAHEHKVRLTKLDHIFITAKSWQNIGGLPGLSLTLQDVGVPNITLHGPEGLDELYHATKRFVVIKDMNVTMATCSPLHDFEDEIMTVRYVLIGPNDNLNLTSPAKKQKTDNSIDVELKEFVDDDTDYYASKKKQKQPLDVNKIVNARDRAAMKTKQATNEKDQILKKKIYDACSKSDCTVAYICSLKKRLGTLDLAKCVEKGVKPGPLLGQLKNGYDVVLPDGTSVSSKEVKTPDEPGPVFIVLEVPQISYLNEDDFAAHFDNGENPEENIPTVIAHYTPPHVFNNPVYQGFMARFGNKTRHLVLNSQNSCLGSEAVHRTQYRLHLLDPDIFPMLKDKSITAVWNQQPLQQKLDSPVKSKCFEELKNKIAIAQFQNIIAARSKNEPGSHENCPNVGNLDVVSGKTLMIQHLKPNKGLDRSVEPKLHIQDYLQETMDINGFLDSLEKFRNIVDEIRVSKSSKQAEYPKVVFLGTGSCIPSKTRNTSAIVTQMSESNSMLLDCGEGTFGQLVRFYGPKRVNAFLRTLKAVYISHLHADHHIGLIGVLQARREAFDEINKDGQIDPLYLLAPGQIYTWLSTYDQHFEKIKPDFVLIPNQHLMIDSPKKESTLTSATLASIGVGNIDTCHVCHCPNAFGVAVQVDPFNKITYSGDTIPCSDLITIGQDSTLLIHEATMEDELAEEARVKMHSTTSQAIEMGRKMKAKYTVLTHFSQRYARLPRLNAQILNDNTTVGIAFDNMQITMNNLELLPFMYAPLQMLFSEHCVEMEMRAANRINKKTKLLKVATDNVANAQRNLSTGYNPHAIEKTSLNSPAPPVKTPTGRKPYSLIHKNLPPHKLYIETHSSRLRQEKKGMPVFGLVRSSNNAKVLKIRSLPPTRQISVEKNKQNLKTNKNMKNITQQRAKSQEPHTVKEPEPLKIERSASEVLIRHDEVEKEEQVIKLEDQQDIKLEDQQDIKLEKQPNNIKCDQEEQDLLNKSIFARNPDLVKPQSTIFARPIPDKFNTKSDNFHSKKINNSLEKHLKRLAKYNAKVSDDFQTFQDRISKDLVDAKPFDPEIMNNDCEREQQLEHRPRKSPRDWNIPRNTLTSPTSEEKAKSPKTNATRETEKWKTARSSPNKQLHESPRLGGSQKYTVNRTTFRAPIYPKGLRVPESTCSDDERNTRVNRGKPPRLTAGNAALYDSQLFDRLSETSSKESMRTTVLSTNNVEARALHKSFQPELEDIRSSYMLLSNTMTREDQYKNEENDKMRKIKPKPLDETQRRKLLRESKRKFSCRSFRTEAKFDKIEGLNWISWK